MSYITDYIKYASFISAGIAAAYGFGLLKHKTINALVILVWVSFLADVVNSINYYYYVTLEIDLGIRHIGDTYRIIELIILSKLFTSFQFNSKAKLFIRTASILISLYYLVIETNFYQIDAPSDVIRASSAILTIVISLLFYKSVITKMEIPNINMWPPFYLISSQFIYFCGVIVAFFIYQPMYNADYFASRTLWAFHNVWLIVRNILLIIGFFYTYKTKYKWEQISLY